MAHLALLNSELHVGLDFTGHPRIEALVSEPQHRAAVLFPGEGAVEPHALPGGPPKTLIVLDGTWTQARKVLLRNPTLLKLPRVGLTPSRPGNYRIRREPAAHCLSTIEAVAEILGDLESDRERFQKMLQAFDYMVELQLAHAAVRAGPLRYKRKRHRQPKKPSVPPELSSDRLVALYAEANVRSDEDGTQARPELVQLVAVRMSSGERFEAVIAPRRPLVASTPHHLEVPAEVLLFGESLASALARFRQFLRPGDVCAVWGPFAAGLLEGEGFPVGPAVDVRVLSARVLGRRTGGVEQAAQLLGGAVPTPWAQGRAGRRIAALCQVIERLRAVEAEGPAEAAAVARAAG